MERQTAQELSCSFGPSEPKVDASSCAPQLVVVSAYESRYGAIECAKYSHALDANAIRRLVAGAAPDVALGIHGPDGSELGVEALKVVERSGYYVDRDGLRLV